MQLQCHRCVAVQQSQGFHSKFIISPKTMFVNDEDFAFVVVCFSILASLTSARAKRCMPKKRKADCVEHHKNAVDAFRGDGFFGKTSCRVLFKRTSDIFVIFVTAQFCSNAFVLTTHAKQHNKFVQNFKKIRSVFTKLDFCSIICIRRSLETLPIPNKIYCTFVIGGVDEKTKIVCTLGPASTTYDQIKKWLWQE